MHRRKSAPTQAHSRSCTNYEANSRKYILRLILLITGLIRNFRHDAVTFISIENAKTKMNSDLKGMCIKAFRKSNIRSENLSSFESVLASLQVIIFLPLSMTTKRMRRFCNDFTRHREIIFLCFIYLNANNWQYLRSISSATDDQLKARRDILKNFIHHHCKENSLTLNQLRFFLECASHLDAKSLTRNLESKLIALNCNCAETINSTISDSTFLKNSAEVYFFETDGVIYEKSRDPPGQKCVYILPGDPKKEMYRLGTYIQFPTEIPVNPKTLAAAGFYYTGYKDRVKCFSCGQCAEKWSFGDDVMSPRWHKADCKMKNRDRSSGNVAISGAMFMSSVTSSEKFGYENFSNQNSSAQTSSSSPSSSGYNENIAVPSSSLVTKPQKSYNSRNYGQPSASSGISSTTSLYQKVKLPRIFSLHHEQLLNNLDLRQESERLKTFENWENQVLAIHPTEFAQSGFYYLGDLDRVQCFSCGGVLKQWRLNDSIDSEHKRMFPCCKMVLGKEEHNIALTSEAREKEKRKYQTSSAAVSTLSEFEKRELQRMFPCLHPVNLHMQSLEGRLATFDYRWPFRQVRATPEDIAEAGFFFLGERDRVKCWYCNGGLQNWDPEDIPWREHAKWFPTCEFLLQKKGPDFVHQIVAIYPDLRRPILMNNYEVSQGSGESTNQRSGSLPPVFIDPKVQRKEAKVKLRQNMNSEVVERVFRMGFELPQIRKLIKRRLQRGDAMYATESDLIEDLTVASLNNSQSDTDESSGDSETTTPSQSATGLLTTTSNVSEMSPQNRERLEKLKNERRCKICLDEMADVVFVPCNHLCSCITCAKSLRDCPICRKKIEKAIRTYIN